MTLKINYIKKQNNKNANWVIAASKGAKISDFKGVFDSKFSQKLIKFINNNKLEKKDNISALNLEFDKKIVLIILEEKKSKLEAEK